MRDESLDRPWAFDWDVIHFNVGLHDLKSLSARKLGKKNGVQVSSLGVYQKKVGEIAKYMKAPAPDAKLIIAMTTPVPDGEPGRVAGDAQKDTQAARQILLGHPGIPINDLYRSIKLTQTKWWTAPGNVHFNKSG
ncbi:SGNH/GDSL hydrolase family protein [Aporhodopirellula aestuarii]|uniref:SGNH/GDSL hydrolase family protein n=1 Tax=Aporhodopirellula aestuarii TaxID=2950107 RepID=A0ABT0UAV1_9BACT|nr:SGNH/GDSL hydrolase family protein [Aporhodopirellula aestuarii]MCM2373940.1 SGNH/GDSL hydrolase family protein [Aporhodopirellula aestuarii]